MDLSALGIDGNEIDSDDGDLDDSDDDSESESEVDLFQGQIHLRSQIKGQILLRREIQDLCHHNHPQQEHPQQQVEQFSPLFFCPPVSLGLRQFRVLPLIFGLLVITSIFRTNACFYDSH